MQTQEQKRDQGRIQRAIRRWDDLIWELTGKTESLIREFQILGGSVKEATPKDPEFPDSTGLYEMIYRAVLEIAKSKEEELNSSKGSDQ